MGQKYKIDQKLKLTLILPLSLSFSYLLGLELSGLLYQCFYRGFRDLLSQMSLPGRIQVAIPRCQSASENKSNRKKYEHQKVHKERKQWDRSKIAQAYENSRDHDENYPTSPSPYILPHLTSRISGGQGCYVGDFTEASRNPKLQNSSVSRTVGGQTEELAFTWGSLSIKIWQEATCKRNVLKHEKGQNEKLQQEL